MEWALNRTKHETVGPAVIAGMDIWTARRNGKRIGKITAVIYPGDVVQSVIAEGKGIPFMARFRKRNDSCDIGEAKRHIEANAPVAL